MVLKEGSKAPNFSLQGSDGKKHSLAEFKGKYLVLYFYPRDNTPGCTIEARNFNKNIGKIRKLDADVVGVSNDDLESHGKFKSKLGLGFVLLSDKSSSTIKNYDSYGNRGVFGIGTIRNTVIIDPKGNVIKIFKKVKPIDHVDDVIEFLKSQR